MLISNINAYPKEDSAFTILQSELSELDGTSFIPVQDSEFDVAITVAEGTTAVLDEISLITENVGEVTMNIPGMEPLSVST